jgi:hypothetical protein
VYSFFVRNSEIDDSINDIFEDLQKREIVVLYIDYRKFLDANNSLFRAVAEGLNLEHQPYGEGELVLFLDDLITLAFKIEGLVIVIDNADEFLSKESNVFFDLIEVFWCNFIIGLIRRSHVTFVSRWNITE